jgi:polar amino acid transport system substrate-binding protein
MHADDVLKQGHNERAEKCTPASPPEFAAALAICPSRKDRPPPPCGTVSNANEKNWRGSMPFTRSSLLGALALTFAATFAHATDMPPVPSAIKEAGTITVGVRCDQPPYGYQDKNGDFAGVEVEMARQIGEWALGSKDKVTLSCVTGENRIPMLMTKKVDFLIATLGITPERQRVIDFTVPYRWGASGLLVKKDSPIRKMADLKGKTVAVLKGTVQAKWFEDNMPDVTTLRLNSSADALQSFLQDRADGYAHDAATLVVVTGSDDSVRLVDDPYQISDAAIGLRKDEPELKAYLDASIKRMHSDNLFVGWIDKYVDQKIRGYYYDVFTKPRPQDK